jgi:hypothetical protein
VRKFMPPYETSSLYRMMPAALQERLPRIPSIHRLLSYREQSMPMSNPDVRQELVPFAQRGCSELTKNDADDFPRPLSADSIESARSSASSTPVSEADAVAVFHYETDSGLGWNRVVPGI